MIYELSDTSFHPVCLKVHIRLTEESNCIFSDMSLSAKMKENAMKKTKLCSLLYNICMTHRFRKKNNDDNKYVTLTRSVLINIPMKKGDLVINLSGDMY